MSDLEEMFKVLLSCCLHDPQWTPEDVEKEVAWIGDRASCRDSDSIVIVRLKSGDLGLLTQSEDYTGHGCQCHSMTVREQSLGQLLTHLQEYELWRLVGR